MIRQYSIHFKKSAQKELSKLPVDIQKRLVTAIRLLAENPRPTGVKPLVSQKNTWRKRIGRYRIIYEIQDDRLIVVVIKIGHRKSICKNS